MAVGEKKQRDGYISLAEFSSAPAKHEGKSLSSKEEAPSPGVFGAGEKSWIENRAGQNSTIGKC